MPAAMQRPQLQQAAALQPAGSERGQLVLLAQVRFLSVFDRVSLWFGPNSVQWKKARIGTPPANALRASSTTFFFFGEFRSAFDFLSPAPAACETDPARTKWQLAVKGVLDELNQSRLKGTFGDHVGKLSSGESFGERVIMGLGRYPSTIIAAEGTELLVIPRAAFHAIVRALGSKVVDASEIARILRTPPGARSQVISPHSLFGTLNL